MSTYLQKTPRIFEYHLFRWFCNGIQRNVMNTKCLFKKFKSLEIIISRLFHSFISVNRLQGGA